MAACMALHYVFSTGGHPTGHVTVFSCKLGCFYQILSIPHGLFSHTKSKMQHIHWLDWLYRTTATSVKSSHVMSAWHGTKLLSLFQVSLPVQPKDVDLFSSCSYFHWMHSNIFTSAHFFLWAISISLSLSLALGLHYFKYYFPHLFQSIASKPVVWIICSSKS